MSETTSDLADDLIPEAPEHIQIRRVDFQPWHKIRKQYIRDFQWNKTILKYMRSLKNLQTDSAETDVEEMDENSSVSNELDFGYPLTCLSIPGEDLLDLRSLQKKMEPRGHRLKYLGFNKGHGSNEEGTKLHIANNQVTSLRGVVRRSLVARDSFQAIARENSVANQYLRNYGPFHVINLDICDTLFPNTTAEYNDYYNAIHRLAEYQMSRQTNPWLLFVTTQVEPGVIDVEGLSKLCSSARINCNNHPDFLERLAGVLPIAAFQSEVANIDCGHLTDKHMASVFGVAFGKWLLKLVTSVSSPWTMTMLSGFKYVIKQDLGVEMLSLGFHFSRHVQPPVDVAGMSSIQPNQGEMPSELEKALHVVDMVQGIRDVDEILRNDSELYDTMEAASADLMESAGFDRREYISWARTRNAVSV